MHRVITAKSLKQADDTSSGALNSHNNNTNYIIDPLNEAKKIFKSTDRRKIILENQNGTNSNISNYEVHNDLIAKQNRPKRGVWSEFGKPYLSNGPPDLDLGKYSKYGKPLQKKSLPNNSHFVIKQDENIINIKHDQKYSQDAKRENYHVPVLEDPKYLFPRDPLQKSAFRIKKSKNGIHESLLTNHLEDPVLNDADKVFITSSVPLSPKQFNNKNKIEKEKFIDNPILPRIMASIVRNLDFPMTLNDLPLTSRVKSKSSVDSLKSKLNFDNSDSKRVGASIISSPLPNNIEEKIEITPENVFERANYFLKNDPVQKLHRDFIQNQHEMKNKLDRHIIERESERIKVMSNPKLIANAASLILKRIDGICDSNDNKDTVSVWEEAKKLTFKKEAGQKQESSSINKKTFISNLNNYVLEAGSSGRIQIAAVSGLLSHLKKLLDFIPLDIYLFPEVLIYLGKGSFENMSQLLIVRYILRELSLSKEDLWRFMYQVGWKLPLSVENFLLREPVDKEKRKFPNDTPAKVCIF